MEIELSVVFVQNVIYRRDLYSVQCTGELFWCTTDRDRSVDDVIVASMTN